MKCITTQGFPVVETGPGEKEGAGQEMVSPEWGLHHLESAVGPGLGTVGWAQFPSQGLHWAKGTSAEKGRGG